MLVQSSGLNQQRKKGALLLLGNKANKAKKEELKMCKRGKLSWHAFRGSLIAASLVVSVIICFGIFSRTQLAHAEEKAQQGIPGILKELEEKIEKKIEEILGRKEKEDVEIPPIEIEPEIHRRILHFLNAARRPEDLVFPSQNELRVVEELDEAHHVGGHEEHLEEERLIQKRVEPILDIELAKRVFDERERHSPLGFTHIAQLRRIDGIPWDKLVFLSGPASYGKWEFPLPELPAGRANLFLHQHAAMLRTGKMLLFGNDGIELWEPIPPNKVKITSPTNQPTNNIFCSGHSFLSDGKLLVVGGGGGSPANITAAWKFDPIGENWQQTTGSLINSRWYPTVVTLGDEPGRILVASGAGAPDTSQMEIYSESADSFSTVGPAATANRSFPQLYPGLHLLPGGEIFYTPTGFRACCNPAPAPDPTVGDSAYFQFSGPTTGGWTNIGPNDRTTGMAVLLLQPTYPWVRVMVVGGGDDPTSRTARIINLSTLSPSWGSTISFPDGLSRTNVNAVLLPDGTVFVCGGLPYSGTPPNGGDCLLYNPSTNTWSYMAKLNYERKYHSVALLLPDGRVMATGGNWDPNDGVPAGANATFEIFSPPYLFKGARPTITSAPALVHHGATFEIETPDASSIGKVVLVRPSAVTHHTNPEQRVIQLSFNQLDSDTLRATMPDGGASPYGVHTHAFAPRGYYMLFILNNNGVPSEAKFIHLH